MVLVYSISRQYGSGGSTFAKILCAKTGYNLVWREVVNQAAAQIGAPDVALAMIDELDLLDLTPDENTLRAYAEAVRKVMFEFAGRGKQIIVGRASQVILAGFPDTLRIRIIAGKETRIRNVSRSKGVNEEAAAAQIAQSDLRRSAFLKKFYCVDWDDPSLYDLVINTDHISPELAADWVIQLPNP